MPMFQVAKNASELGKSTPVEADGVVSAALKYVAEHSMRPGTYFVRRLTEAKQVTISATRQLAAGAEGEAAATLEVEEI